MADNCKLPVLVICGPTASGKTALAVNLAQKLNAEIISADSIQIYKQLNVGTAKPTEDEMQGINHHLIDFLQPNIKFSVADYIVNAQKIIEDIHSRNKTVIICGGTGQYISGLVNGISFIGAKPDTDLREKLTKQAQEEGIQVIYDKLCEVDKEYALTLHPNNQGRVIRAMELYIQTGKTMSEQLAASLPPEKPYNELVLCLNFDDRSKLYDRINLRVDLMMKRGLLNEAKLVYDNKENFYTAAQAIGYKEFFDYFEEVASIESCIDKLKQASRNYAKRQLTWFKRINNIKWLNAEKDILNEALQLWEIHNGR